MVELVFIHGLFGSASNWNTVRSRLWHEASSHAVQLPIDDSVARDHKSFGGIPSLTEYVDEYIYNLGSRQVVVVGNSLGGQVALDYAAKHPHKNHPEAEKKPTKLIAETAKHNPRLNGPRHAAGRRSQAVKLMVHGLSFKDCFLQHTATLGGRQWNHGASGCISFIGQIFCCI
jgi:pimeloyl-ACP methyl ester carboxylesterase